MSPASFGQANMTPVEMVEVSMHVSQLGSGIWQSIPATWVLNPLGLKTVIPPPHQIPPRPYLARSPEWPTLAP